MKPIIQTIHIEKHYHMGETTVKAVDGIDFILNKGEFASIIGASGSGKSTLMNLLGCLDGPTSGKYYFDGLDMSKVKMKEYARVRNEKIGFVFQNFNLLPRTSALENVELPLIYDRNKRIKNPKMKAIEVLKMVGLENRMNHDPNQLSGGQQQRVAIARALVNEPSLILADEPTGNLDTHTTQEIMGLFKDLNKEGITIILVTHEKEIARETKRIIELSDGKIINDELIN